MDARAIPAVVALLLVTQCLVSAVTTRACALRGCESLHAASCTTCDAYPSSHRPEPDIRSDPAFDLGYVVLGLEFNSTAATPLWPAARAAAVRVVERCLRATAPCEYEYDSYALEVDSGLPAQRWSSGQLFVRVRVPSNATSAVPPSLAAWNWTSPRTVSRVLQCAATAAPGFAFRRVHASGYPANMFCGDGLVDGPELCDASPYCSRTSCTCTWGAAPLAGGGCAALAIASVVTAPAPTAEQVAAFERAFAQRCCDTGEISARAELDALGPSPRVRVVLEAARDAYPGARAPRGVLSVPFVECYREAAREAFGSGAQAEVWVDYSGDAAASDQSSTAAALPLHGGACSGLLVLAAVVVEGL
eukprot:m51a1_g6013 hypothetical protein (362) ;mRNA; f:68935-70176